MSRTFLWFISLCCTMWFYSNKTELMSIVFDHLLTGQAEISTAAFFNIIFSYLSGEVK